MAPKNTSDLKFYPLDLVLGTLAECPRGEFDTYNENYWVYFLILYHKKYYYFHIYTTHTSHKFRFYAIKVTKTVMDKDEDFLRI